MKLDYVSKLEFPRRIISSFKMSMSITNDAFIAIPFFGEEKLINIRYVKTITPSNITVVSTGSPDEKISITSAQYQTLIQKMYPHITVLRI